MKYIDYFDSLIGTLEIIADEKYLLKLRLTNSCKNRNPNKITKITKNWLNHYFSKNQPSWIPPLLPFNSTFSQKVIDEVLDIPFGKCKSYSEIAKDIGNPKAYRAVALVMKNNPYMIVVPCHRVISKKGLGGYNSGIEVKKRLLKFENCKTSNSDFEVKVKDESR